MEQARLSCESYGDALFFRSEFCADMPDDRHPKRAYLSAYRKHNAAQRSIQRLPTRRRNDRRSVRSYRPDTRERRCKPLPTPLRRVCGDLPDTKYFLNTDIGRNQTLFIAFRL